MTGIYIHIPFCKSKCPYCDFYSFRPDNTQKDSYLKAVLLCLEGYKSTLRDEIDTLYFGGGTPSFFGGERIKSIIEHIKEGFSLCENAEITVECNPSSVDGALADTLAEAGVNRISLGLQSASETERRALGRSSGAEKVRESVRLFQSAGISNISLDLMLGIPCQTRQSLEESIDLALSLDITHLSAYMLKIEEGTLFSRLQRVLSLPDEEEVAELYLHCAELLEERGFRQYEISNFCREGFESRHNLHYWHCEEYLGIGPSAHSFLKGRRFYYERDFEKFITCPETVDDGAGGDREEYIMLALRLTEGLRAEEYKKRFGESPDRKLYERAAVYEKAGLLTVRGEDIALTREGFLLSNSLIGRLIG